MREAVWPTVLTNFLQALFNMFALWVKDSSVYLYQRKSPHLFWIKLFLSVTRDVPIPCFLPRWQNQKNFKCWYWSISNWDSVLSVNQSSVWSLVTPPHLSLTCPSSHHFSYTLSFRNHSPLMSFGASFVSFLVSAAGAGSSTCCWVKWLMNSSLKRSVPLRNEEFPFLSCVSVWAQCQ